MTWQSQVFALLTASLVRPLVLAAAAALVLRVLRVRHPASRHAAWTAVLIGMLLLPLASAIAPKWKLALLPRHENPAVQTPLLPDDTNASDPSGFVAGAVPSASHTSPKTKAFEWPTPGTIVLWGYLAGVLVMAVYRVTGWMMLTRVMSRSRALRLRRLRESSDVLTPVTVGVLRPSVILPAEWREWNANTKRAVLTHEFAHIRRGDTWISFLTRLAKCVYWFHPLAWWVSRQIADLAELSCDAVVLEKNGDPGGYSRILLGFSETVQAAGYRAAMPGLAIASRSGMSHRIDQVFELASGNPGRFSRPGIVLSLMGLPVMCLAAVIGLTASVSHISHHVTAATTQPQPLVIAQLQEPVESLSQSPQPIPTTKPKFTHPPEFDAVSIRPGTSEGGGRGGPPGGGPLRFAPGRVVSGSSAGVTVARIILDAYHLEATAGDSSANDSQLRLMLQAMLPDRFKLVLHHGTSERHADSLVMGKTGPGSLLREIGDAVSVAERVHAGQNRMIDRGTIHDLADRLAAIAQVDQPVTDKTELKGERPW